MWRILTFLDRLLDTESPGAHPEPLLSMKTAEEIVSYAFRQFEEAAKPGAATQHMARLAAGIAKRASAIPYFPEHRRYPAIICTPVNDEVVRTLPSSRLLESGDLLTCEFGVRLYGEHAFLGWTFPVGKISAEDAAHWEATYEALQAGIQAARAGEQVSAVSLSIEKTLHSHGLAASQHFAGYEIGREAYMRPFIPCHSATATSGAVLEAGKNYIIVAISHAGAPDVVRSADGWNVKTADGTKAVYLSAMVQVEETGTKILTIGPKLRH